MFYQFVIVHSVEMKHSFMLSDTSVFVGLHLYTLFISVNWSKDLMTRQNQLRPSGDITFVSAFTPMNEAYLFIEHQNVFSLYFQHCEGFRSAEFEYCPRGFYGFSPSHVPFNVQLIMMFPGQLQVLVLFRRRL